MNKITKTLVGFVLLGLLFIFSCQKKNENPDSVIEGKATVYVDESILPIVEDEAAVFEAQYNATLNLVAKSESEIVNSLLNDTARIAILTRKLSNEEQKAFQSKKLNPKTYPFAIDAVAFIKNKATNDSLVALKDVIDFLKGKTVPGIKGLVFDNPNSSTMRYLSEVSGVNVVNQKNVFSFKTNQEAIEHVANNKDLIGVIGMNWIFQPPLQLQDAVDKVNVLAVKGLNKTEYVFPTQDDLASGKYPLARHLYIINCQGYSGLGRGLSLFLTGERGQRIILKSGLVPEHTPGRKIVIRNTVNKDKN